MQKQIPYRFLRLKWHETCLQQLRFCSTDKFCYWKSFVIIFFKLLMFSVYYLKITVTHSYTVLHTTMHNFHTENTISSLKTYTTVNKLY